jgi:hypothetical protein
MSKEMMTINGKVYKAKEVDFNFICELGEAGIDIADISKKLIPTVRVYAAYCMNTDIDSAGDEINAHLISGGTFDDITTVFTEKIEDSDFFRALTKTAETNTPKKTSKKKDAEVSE